MAPMNHSNDHLSVVALRGQEWHSCLSRNRRLCDWTCSFPSRQEIMPGNGNTVKLPRASNVADLEEEPVIATSLNQHNF